MERKTKHRILGIFVVIGLVVISLPFFQADKDAQTQALVKAPPFPDQSVQVTSAATQPAVSPAQAQSTSDQSQVTPPVINAQAANQDMNQQPDEAINATHMAAVEAQVPEITAPNLYSEPATDKKTTPDTVGKLADASSAANDVNGADVQEQQTADVSGTNKSSNSPTPAEEKSATDRPAQNKPAQPAKKPFTRIIKRANHITPKHVETPKVKLSSIIHAPIDDNGLFKMKNAAWVIQMGSFKNKANALRLVNQLRANGYPAFIQQVAANTRVFVGPEPKQTSARALAGRLEADLKMRGIVISYKPLTM